MTQNANDKSKSMSNAAKSAVFAIGIASIGAAIAISMDGNTLGVKAEGEVMESESSSTSSSQQDSSEVTTKPVEEQPWYEPALDWIDNKIVPLLGSVSVVSILGAVTSVVTAIAKHKGDKKTQLTITLQDVKITQLENTVTELKQHEEEMLANYQNVLDSASQTMQLTANYAKTQADLIAEQNMKVESVYKMKDCIDISCRLIAKSLALSDTAVKSGIADDAQKLVETLKRIESEGNGGE